MTRYLFPSLLVALLFSSCIGPNEMRYFQEEDLSEIVPAFYPQESPQYTLIPNDIISVRIKTDDPQFSQNYNIIQEGSFMQGTPGANFLSGYSIDDSGTIQLPVIGKVEVAGLTISQARDTVQARIDQQLNEATVIAHLINFKISIMGEVRNPGYYYVFNNQINVFEGIAMAGDMLETADRSQVFLIRQQDGGTEATPVDLTKLDVLNSEQYFLQPNDVLYVAPLEAKSQRSNLITTTVANTIFAGLSTATTVILLVTNLSD